MAANGQGFAFVVEFENIQPVTESKLKNKKMKLRNKSPTMLVNLE
jgi:hypothetical protein